MKLKNPPLFFLFLLFIILNIGDAVTTYFIQDGESNPLFHIFGGMWFVVLIKFLFILAFYYIYNRNRYHNNFTYFLLVSAMTMGNMALGLAVYVNVNAIMHPAILEAAAQVPTGERTQVFFTFVSIIYYIPLAINLICFWLYDKSHKHVLIKKEESKHYVRRFWKWIRGQKSL